MEIYTGELHKVEENSQRAKWGWQTNEAKQIFRNAGMVGTLHEASTYRE